MKDERKIELQKEGEKDRVRQEDLYSQVVKAGNRTYFLDVKKTRYDDPYVVLTESKKKVDDDGKFYYDKYKVYLYQEDMDEFKAKINDVANFMESYLQTHPRSEKSRVKNNPRRKHELSSCEE